MYNRLVIYFLFVGSSCSSTTVCDYREYCNFADADHGNCKPCKLDVRCEDSKHHTRAGEKECKRVCEYSQKDSQGEKGFIENVNHIYLNYVI